MNDRDALIEDATKFANWNENHGRTIAAKMIRALISLASPSPAQTEDRPERCTCQHGRDHDGSEFGPCPYCERIADEDAAVERMAREMAARKMGLVKDVRGERLPEDLWRQCEDEARAALSSPSPAQTAPTAPPEDAIGAAERGVGQWVYRRIEVLMDAEPGTPEGIELAYLAAIASDVEEYGATGDHPVSPSPAQWPEDVVERVRKSLQGVLDGQFGMPVGRISAADVRAALATLPPPEDASDGFATELIQWLEARGHSFPGGLDADTAISLLDDHETALMAPDERVKGLVSALEDFLKKFDGGWATDLVRRRLDSALASYRGGA